MQLPQEEGNPALGLYLKLYHGETPVHVPADVMEALYKVVVTVSNNDIGAFQLYFTVKRENSGTGFGYSVIDDTALALFKRIVISVCFGVGTTERVLIDGLITHQQFNIKEQEITFTVIGRDYSILMDLKSEKCTEIYKEKNSMAVVQTILSKAEYAKYFVFEKEDSMSNFTDTSVPKELQPPPPSNKPSASDDTPQPGTNQNKVQNSSDLKFIRTLIKPLNYVFYLEPPEQKDGKAKAYCGSPMRKDGNKTPILVNMSVFTNVENIDFKVNPLNDGQAKASGQDEQGNPYVVQLATDDRNELIREFLPKQDNNENTGNAQNELDNLNIRAKSKVVTVTGELDSMRYGYVLKPGYTVEIRGAGKYDGKDYTVKDVEHTITKGSYKQKFTLNGSQKVEEEKQLEKSNGPVKKDE